MMIKNGTFTSVWDGGFEVTTNCKVNMETKEVFDIKVSEGTEDLVNDLNYEYVTVDGENHFVSYNGEEDTEYWYE
jgi:hypothetical protein